MTVNNIAKILSTGKKSKSIQSMWRGIIKKITGRYYILKRRLPISKTVKYWYRFTFALLYYCDEREVDALLGFEKECRRSNPRKTTQLVGYL